MDGHIDSSNAVKIFVKEYIQPFLKNAGFSKTGMNFYRQRGDIIDAIIIEGSTHNGWGNSMFFVNYCMESHEFQAITGQPQNTKIHYSSCLYNRRLHEGPDSRQNLILMEQGRLVDFEQFSKDLLNDLQQVIDYLDEIHTTQQLVAIALDGRGLWQYENLCYYLAKTRDIRTLKTYVRDLHTRFHSDIRWPSISTNIASRIGEYSSDSEISPLLG